MNILGLHHVTAIASDPRRNLDFYTRVLGLRLLKKTVNFDDPSTYHLYYGDSVGTPGTALTFFPWTHLPRGRVGSGQVTATAWSVSPDALPFWETRLRAHDVELQPVATRFGEPVLAFTDPDGLVLELVGTNEPDLRVAWSHPEIPAGFGLRGFHGVTLGVTAGTAPATAALLGRVMGHREHARDGHRVRYTIAAGGPGTYVDLLADPSLPRGLSGAGTVHHVAFRTPDRDTELAARSELAAVGLDVSPQIDRTYFHSIYYREPSAILFEIATDSPGFAIDEPVENLGATLRLPPQYESRRAEIEAALPPLHS